jgi:hypothetical protein
MSEILFSLIFGHFIADFLLQTNSVSQAKSSKGIKKRLKGLAKHILTHFITYIIITALICSLLTVDQSMGQLITPIIVILFFHFLIDIAKVEISLRTNLTESTWGSSLVFIFDQVLHLITIIVALIIFHIISYDWPQILHFVSNFFFEDNISFSSADKVLIIGTLVLFNTYFCGYLLEKILIGIRPTSSFTDSKTETKLITKFNEQQKRTQNITIERTDTETAFNDSSIQIGKYIGMLERLLIMFLVASKSITGIAFLIAMKALTRFKQFDDKSFAEYYLIGSLLSVLFGTLTGYITINVLK